MSRPCTARSLAVGLFAVRSLVMRSTASLAVALCLATSSRAMAQDADVAARKHYEHGVALYQQGKFKESLSDLVQARELSRSYTILLNIGQVRAAMSDFLGAIEAYRQYLNEGGARLTAEQRKAVQGEINDFESRLATPVVASDVPFADVFVDSNRVGQTPIALRLNPGNHELKVVHKDHPAQQRRVALASGTRERIAFELRAPNQAAPVGQPGPGDSNPAPSSGPASPQSPSSRTSSLAPSSSTPSSSSSPSPSSVGPVPSPPVRKHDTGRTIAWSAVGTLAAGAAVTGVWALFSNHSLTELRDDPPPRDHSAMESQATKTRVLAILADGFAVSAIGLGVWLTLDKDAFRSTKSGSAPGLQLRAGPGNISLRARF